jgi:hypothetical protein
MYCKEISIQRWRGRKTVHEKESCNSTDINMCEVGNYSYLLWLCSRQYLVPPVASMGSSTENISFIPARQGGFHLKDKTGFLYYKTKPQKAKDRCYWSCLSKKDSGCTATAITQISTKTLIRLCGNHNHGIELLENMTRLVEAQKIEEAAGMPTVLPRTVLGMYFSPLILIHFP